MSAQSDLRVVAGRDVSCAQTGTGARETSFATSFPGFPGARALDLDAYQRAFPDKVMAYFKATGLRPTQIAVVFNVTERTALNWLRGVACPSGWTMSVIAQADPDGFAAHFTTERDAA